MKIKHLATIAFGFVTPFVMAQEGGNGGFIEAVMGSTKVKLDTPSGWTKNESSTGFEVLGGYMLNRNFGLEIGYVDLGKASMGYSGAGTSTLFGQSLVTTGAFSLDAKGSGIKLGLRALIPVSDRVSVSGSIGVLNWNTDMTFKSTGSITYGGKTSPINGSYSQTFGGSDPYLGVKAHYEFHKNTYLGVGFTSYKLGGNVDTDVSSTELSLHVKF